MGRIFRVLLCLAVALTAGVSVQAKVRLPRLVGDGMVLQRETPVKIWGWGSAGESVKVTFQEKTYKTRADRKGDWSVELPPLSAGGPYTMRVNDIEIKDILVGDVWLCSGQSNMELPIRRVLDLYADEVKDVRNPYIRYFRVPMKYSFGREETDLTGGEWKPATPEYLLDFSAAAWFFAKELHDLYGIPVGIINNAVGGSPAEAWVSRGFLKNYPRYVAEADRAAAPGYVESVRRDDAQKGRRWYESLQADPGTSVWNRFDFDDSDWESISLPGFWTDKDVEPVTGNVWFRKDIELPAEMAGGEATLRMGVIVDADSTFVNGTFVGNVTYRYPPRIYRVPAGVLKEGRNNITVKVTSNSGGGRGGFVEEKPYKLIAGENEIDLTGEWRYKIGIQVAPPAPQTTFQYVPTGLYNGILAPLKNYALKGFLWYQGESNTGRAAEYRDLMSELVNDWREKWNAPAPPLPFIYAQLPDFSESSGFHSEHDDSGWAELREAQRQNLIIPRTGMAVTLGTGEWNDVHPLDKKTVAHRLALEARRVAYGESDLVSRGPMFESMEIRGGERGDAVLTFSSVGSGIYTNLRLAGFQIAGADGKYVDANATPLSENTVRVWSDAVPHPAAVRYAWDDNPVGANLKNREGLPASPFRAETTVTENATGRHNGYDWELWHDVGDVAMTLKEGGAFECSWDNMNNALFRTGKKFDSTKTHDQLGEIFLDYGCDYRPDGNSYLCVYGWSVDPLVEFYVVEAWGDWRPPGAVSKGQIEIDGGTYDVYETIRTEQPSIQGVRTFRQFWSVRTDKKTGGTVSLSDHIRAWEKHGMKLDGKIYEIAFCVEGFRSRGAADVYKHELRIRN